MIAALFSKRRRYIIDKKMQMQPVRSILAQGLLLGIGFLITIYIVGQKFTGFFETFVTGDDSARVNFFRDINFVFLGYFGYSFLVMIVTSYFSVVFTNKIAGPVFNMLRVLEKNETEGSFDVVRLRKDDLLQNLAEKINVLIEISKKAKGSSSSASAIPKLDK